MAIELITGHAGSAHVSSADAGYCNGGIFGTGMYVLNIGTKFEAEVQSANLVTIGTGAALFNGRYVRVTSTENVSIDNGAQGVSRNDIICVKYEYDSGTGEEEATLVVIKGTATSGTPSDPTVPSGNIINGVNPAYMPLWRIPISGLTVNTPEKLYGDTMRTLNDAGIGTVAASRVTGTLDAARIPNLSASKITSGTLGVDRIPSLDAAKITSGTLATARIPALDASKVTTGTFNTARIPSLDASKITTGTFSADRIPSISASKIASGTLSADRIPGLAASKIASGILSTDRIPSLDASKIASGTLATARIPSLDASKITSGAFTSARIPSLDVSKITSGVFSAARGGTGHTYGYTWQQLGTSTGSTAISYDLSVYSEVLVACYIGTDYLGTAVVPKALLSSTARQLYLGGGVYDSVAASGRYVGISVSETKATPTVAQQDGVNKMSSAHWYVFAR